MTATTDIRKEITDRIVATLEAGGLPPWRTPWAAAAGLPRNAASGRAYSGINPVLLQIAAETHGLRSRWWATFNQWAALGGAVKRRPAHVPPGRWGTRVVLYKPVTKATVGEDGKDAEDRFWVMRTFTVFNLDQVDGPLDRLRDTPPPAGGPPACDRAEAVIAATGADLRPGGDRACYCPAGDYIRLPDRSRFVLPEYYETAFHELVHWAEHPARLNWDRAGEGYAMGELVAELGGVYLAGEVGLPVADRLTNHAAYLQHWLAGMRGDTRFIFRAASQASRAASYILSHSTPPQPADAPDEALAV